MAEEPQHKRKTHRKTNSIHRRRGLELNNPGAFADDLNIDLANAALGGSERKASEVTELFNPAEKQKPLFYPGDMIEVENSEQEGRVDVAMIHWVSEGRDLLGVEYEGPVGKTDGANDQGQRFMRTPDRCAAFINPQLVRRIISMGTPPRFKCSHDIYPGDVVMVDKKIGVGIARYVSAQIVGVELNAAVGTSDGLWEGRRYFTVGKQKAFFSPPSMLKKIHPEDLLTKLNQAVENMNVLGSQLQQSQEALGKMKATLAKEQSPQDKINDLETHIGSLETALRPQKMQ